METTEYIYWVMIFVFDELWWKEIKPFLQFHKTMTNKQIISV